jgi:hypothetical protein
MEWALDPDALKFALGELPETLAPNELQELLADAELSLFTGAPEVSEELVRCGWFLHAIGSAGGETIDWDRRQRAFRISAHILELAQLGDRPVGEKLELTFGSMLGYRRGGLDPNATAVFSQAQKLLSQTADAGSLWSAGIAVEAGIYLLGFRTRDAFGWLRTRREAFESLREATGLESIEGTMFGPARNVVESCFGLLRYLIFGDRRGFESSQANLRSIFEEGGETATTNEQWVAAHLLSYSDEVKSTSIWSALPDAVPSAVRRALTSTSPPVLTLWEPQARLLKADGGAQLLSSETKRAILSIPTSAGKTLIAQIIVLSELAREDRSVCLIAPQRSLVREIRRALLPRVRALRKNLGRELPDFAISSVAEIVEMIGAQEPADVDILTPERFAALLRADADAVLAKYSLFIFDEAHLVGDGSRGFTLEGALSYLNWRTRETDHRIMLMSAAIGNEAAFKTWLEGDEPGITYRSQWRGPRRLSAAFTTRPHWDAEEHVEPTGRVRLHRLRYALDGVISFAIPGAEPRTYSSSEPIGELVFRRNDDGSRGDRDADWSSPHYSHVASLALYLEHAGPVLAVTGTRSDAQRLAKAITDGTAASNCAVAARDAVAAMLDPAHPLVSMLEHGVAYHHAGLPLEVLALLEDELRAGRLKHLVCTTTLTEGVNLPVHTVILAETRWENSQVLLSGPRMLNAIGRAGRAGIETEGWVVFAPSGRSPTQPEAHLPDPDQLQIRSQLDSEKTIAEFADFERTRASAEQSVFSDLSRNLQDFTSFVWYVMACEEALAGVINEDRLLEIVGSLFLTKNLDEDALAPVLAFARDVRQTYAESNPESRRSWARAGTRVSSAKRLDELATVLAGASLDREDRGNTTAAIEILKESGVLAGLLGLPEIEESTWRFRVSPLGDHIDVDIAEALLLWISGERLAAIADTLLPMIDNREWRLEQVVDHVSRGFGHSVSWMLSIALDRANALLAEAGATPPICPALPLYVRYGVDSAAALRLITGPVRNRDVAVRVARAAVDSGIADDDFNAWLGGIPVLSWPERFDARRADVLDLIDAISEPAADSLRRLLQGETVQFPLEGRLDPQPVTLDLRDGELPLAEIRNSEGDSLLVLPASLQADLRNVLSTGVDLIARLDPDMILSLRLAEAGAE